MSRKLTTPRVPTGITNTIEQNIPRLSIDFGFIPNPDGDGAIIDLTKTAITYSVADVGQAGTATKINKRSVYHADWPPKVVQAVRQIMVWVESNAEANGLLDPGTSSADI